jgi:hypothetical protein
MLRSASPQAFGPIGSTLALEVDCAVVHPARQIGSFRDAKIAGWLAIHD